MAINKEAQREKELSRRELMKLALAGGGYVLLPGDRAFAKVPSSFATSPKSPSLRPFVAPLRVPPQLNASDPVAIDPDDYENELRRRAYGRNPNAKFIGDNTVYSSIIAEARRHRFHPDLPLTEIWSYRPVDAAIPAELNGQWDFALGPTLTEVFGAFPLNDTSGGGRAVHYKNTLKSTQSGFGVPYTTVHFHGGHHPARGDGFPTNIQGFPDFVVPPDGGEFDYYFPTLDVGEIDGDGVNTERPSTLWYHDHLLDFTGANVYRGLAGMLLCTDIPSFDEYGLPRNFDGDDEEDDLNPTALRLPSGIGVFDIPLVIQDKLFAADGSLVFDPFNHNGFLGDTFCVNGTVQPYKVVQRRKYRFRFLNASTARMYAMYLTNSLGYKFPMHLIGLDSSLLSRAIETDNFLFAPAERVEVVVDFGAPDFAMQKEIFFENRLRQTDGRKPDGISGSGVKIMKFILADGAVDDPSQIGIPNTSGGYDLRPFEPISQQELAGAVRRTFEFNRSHGAWTINGKLAGDLEKPIATPKAGRGEIWRLVNKSGGWWHPIHIHSEFFRIIRRRGRTPGFAEKDGVAKKEVVLLRDNDDVEVYLKFRDHLGPFVFHCHNLAHEDMAMMGRFEVVELAPGAVARAVSPATSRWAHRIRCRLLHRHTSDEDFAVTIHGPVVARLSGGRERLRVLRVAGRQRHQVEFPAIARLNPCRPSSTVDHLHSAPRGNRHPRGADGQVGSKGDDRRRSRHRDRLVRARTRHAEVTRLHGTRLSARSRRQKHTDADDEPQLALHLLLPPTVDVGQRRGLWPQKGFRPHIQICG